MKTYFINDGQQQKGPFTIEELKSQLVKPNDMVWSEGMENWQPASEMNDLKPLFSSVPPPLIPKPIEPTDNKNAVGNANPKSNKKLFIYLGAGLGALLLIGASIFLIASLSSKKSNDETINAALLAKADSLKSAAAMDSSTKANSQNASIDEKNMTPEQKEQAKKEKYKKNWRNYVSVHPTYMTGPMGGISNITITLTNNMPYKLDKVNVWLKYIRVDNSVYKTAGVYFANVGANQTVKKNAAFSDKGMKLIANISKISCTAIELTFPEE